MPHTADNILDQTLKACKRAFIYVVFFGFIVSFLTLATSIYSLEVFDRVLSSGRFETLIALTIIMIVFSALLNFVQGIRSSILHDIGNFIDNKLSASLISTSFTTLKTDSSKTFPSHSIKDLSTIKNFISGNYFVLAIDAPWSVIYMIVIFMIHPLLGVVVVIGAVLLVLLAFINNTSTKNLSLKVNEASLQINKELEIIERNVEVVEAMRMKGNLIHNWSDHNLKLQKLQNKLLHKSNVISGITKFLRSLIYVGTIAFGAFLVITNKMSSGGIIACSILSSKALAPFDAGISLWHSFLSSRKSYEKLKKLVKENFVKEEATSLPEPLGKINIEKLAFIPAKMAKPIINGVNIVINPGEIVAIIGPTASGKSTLAKLIVGIYKPSSGAVRLDDADIQNWKSDELAEYIGYLPQDIELFNGSVKTNIARMQKESDDKKIIEATKTAFVHDMILRLPKAYETDVGLWGTKISAGQRQRIALARAFYGNPKLVVLDEPNSNLDGEGDLALSNSLKEAKKRKITTIIISHRPQILEVVDKILVLVNGEAKLYGPKDEVIKKLAGNGGMTK